MLSFTSYTKVGLQNCYNRGFLMSGVSLLVSLVYLIMKLVNWYGFDAGQAPIIIGVFLMGSLQLFYGTSWSMCCL